MNKTKLKSALLPVALFVGVGCGETAPKKRAAPAVSVGGAPASVNVAATTGAAPATTGAAAAGNASGWGTIKGKLVWGKAELPAKRKLDVTKDQDWCLEKGDVFDPALAVDPKTKGIGKVICYVRNPTAIHKDFPKTADEVQKEDEKKFLELNKFSYADIEKAVKDGKIKVGDIKAQALIDQVRCIYVPHALAVREGMRTVILNPEPKAHNVSVKGFDGKNDMNPIMPPNSLQVAKWSTEPRQLSIECNIHGWMKGFAFVFNHPYYATTAEDGSFEIKNVPAGKVTFFMRKPEFIDPSTGGVGKPAGYEFVLGAGETKDFGEIKYSIE